MNDWQRRRSSAYALCYAAALPTLEAVAREHGYALGVHGSMETDLDLIAAPWSEKAVDAETLIEALRAAVQGVIRADDPEPYPRRKPHGRLAWSIFTDEKGARLGDGPYLDVSVLPRLLKEQECQP